MKTPAVGWMEWRAKEEEVAARLWLGREGGREGLVELRYIIRGHMCTQHHNITASIKQYQQYHLGTKYTNNQK